MSFTPVPATNACMQCAHTVSGLLMNGWRFRNGQFAKLCNLCGSLYKEGRFCDAFHKHQDGWRNCESCQKAIHCGCVASFNQFIPSDSCGIICMKCSEFSLMMARRSNLVAAIPSLLDANQEERERIGKIFTSSVVIPLFEKPLSASDTDERLGRLVIPKRFAQAFFLPEISELAGGGRGCGLKFLDTDGKEWEFGLGQCLSTGGDNKLDYVLDGLKEFMILKQWRAVDVVTFYRIEPEKKFVIGLIKSAATQQSHVDVGQVIPDPE